MPTIDMFDEFRGDVLRENQWPQIVSGCELCSTAAEDCHDVVKSSGMRHP